MNLTISSNYTNQSLIIRKWDLWDYSLLVCVIFGMFGNTLSILVMISKKLRNSNTALLVSYYINYIKLKFTLKSTKLNRLFVLQYLITFS